MSGKKISRNIYISRDLTTFEYPPKHISKRSRGSGGDPPRSLEILIFLESSFQDTAISILKVLELKFQEI